MSSLSAYEQARAARIARNTSTLAALGLAGLENSGWRAPQPGRAARGGGKRAAEGAARRLPAGKRQRVERSAGSADGIRRSPRDPAARGTETRVIVRPAAEPWEQSVFKAREACPPCSCAYSALAQRYKDQLRPHAHAPRPHAHAPPPMLLCHATRERARETVACEKAFPR